MKKRKEKISTGRYLFSLLVSGVLSLFISIIVFQIGLSYSNSDIHNYIDNHNNFEYSGMNINYILYQDLSSSYIFYKIMQALFIVIKDDIVSLQILCFLSSTLFIQPIVLIILNSHSHIKWKWFSMICILCHPKFLTLVTSNIRGALAISLVFFGLQQKNSFIKIIFLSVSPFLHLSSLVIIQFYYLYISISNNSLKLNRNKQIVLTLLNSIIISGYLVINIDENINPGGFLYLIAISIVLIYLLINISKTKLNFDFSIAISLVAITIGTYMYQFGGIRFFSYALPFISIGCVKDKNLKIIKNLSIVFFFFSIAGLYYWLALPGS